MPELPGLPYDYRNRGVPTFDDGKPLFVFDGTCALCSSGAAFLLRHDRHGRINMASAQSPLGIALYRYYGIPLDDSYLFIASGRSFTKSRGYLELAHCLGGVWQLAIAARLVPERVRDWLYDRLAMNRYRWFGRVEQCVLLTPEQRTRLLN